MRVEVAQGYRHFRMIRTAILTIGLALIVVPLLADAVGAGQVEVGVGQAILMLIGFLALLVGLVLRREDLQSGRAFGRRLAWLYRAVGLMLLNVIVILIVIEIIALAVIKLGLLPKGLEPSQSPYYAAQEWANQYWSEYYAVSKTQYQPYTVWRRAPFAGETITINEAGRRETPGADCNADAYRVFTFGGSTMWGLGAPDWGTIPAHLQTRLTSLREGPVCVVNFAEPAWVSTQSIIALMLQLQETDIPDLVIFYDGINEIYAAAQAGKPVAHQNLSQITAYVEGGWAISARRLLEATNTFQLLQALGLATGLDAYRIADVDIASLGEGVTQAYLQNHVLVGALAAQHGFDYAFFWQPTIAHGDKPLTEEEEALKAALGEGTLVALFAEVYEHVRQAANESSNLYNIADVFDAQDGLIYVDPLSHVTPEGNALIAQRMLDLIGEQLGWE